MGISGMEREGEAALPRRDTILLVPVMRVSGGGGCLVVAREFPPSIYGCSALPHLSLHGVAGGEREAMERKKPGVDGTPGRRFIRGQIVVTGQPGLGKRNPGKTGDGSGTGP